MSSISTAVVLAVWAAPAAAQVATQDAGRGDRETAADGRDVVVTGRRAVGDTAGTVSSLAGLPVDNLDLPRTLNVITSQKIDQQQPLNFVELLRNDSAVGHTANGDVTNGTAFTTVRGLPVSDFYVDGLRNQYFGQVASSFIQAVESVEVIEGPAGVLTGGNNLGGTINTVFKKPQFAPHYFLQGGVGFTGSTRHPDYSGVADATGPLTDALAYRVIVAGQSLGILAGGPSNVSFSISPSLTLKLGGRGTATLFTDYGVQTLRYADLPGYPAFGTLLPNASGLRFTNETPFVPTNSYVINHTHDARLNVTYDLLDHLTLIGNAQVSYLAWRQYQGLFAGLADPVKQNTELLAQSFGAFPTDYASGQVKLTSDAHVLGVANLFAFGVDFYSRIAKTLGSVRGPNLVVALPYAPTPLNYGALPAAPANNNRDVLTQTSVYAQDQLTPVAWLNLTGGVRLDHVSDTTTSLAGRFPLKLDRVTYNFAAAVKPSAYTSIYVQYGTGFAPPAPTSLSFTGTPFGPEGGSNLEAGAKGKLLGGLYVRAAIFHEIRENVLTPDPVNVGYSVATGRVRVNGGELNVDGQVLPGLDFAVSYTHLATRILADNTTANGVAFANVGKRILNIPNDAARLYGHYVFPRASGLHGFAIGAGVTYSSDFDVVNNVTAASVIPNVANTLGTGTVPSPLVRDVTLPSFALVDANTSYTLGHYKVQLNATNLFDKTYYPNGRNISRIYIGRPRQLLLTLSTAF